MKLLKKLSRLLRLRPKDLFPGFEYPIEEACKIGGTTYYKFSSEFSIPYQRALMAMTFYTESTMRVDREYLELHTKAVEKILKSDKIDIYEIKKLNDFLKDRLTWIVDTDLVYKLASVVYFDENESPAKYDFEYNNKKIESWKANSTIHDFFLSVPIVELIPYIQDYKGNLDEYSKVTQMIKEEEKKKLENILHN